MAKNSGIIGGAAVLLIAAASGQGGLGDILGGGSSQGRQRPPAPLGGGLPIKAFELGSILKDLHKMTDIMNRMDNLGQMVLNPPPPPKLPPPGALFGKAMPDLSGIIENIGPLMAAFTGGSGSGGSSKFDMNSLFGDENENDIF